MKNRIKQNFKGFSILLKSVPPVLMTLFVISVFSMNLMANKSIALPYDFLALDCGMLISWFAFLAMDIVTKHFGPRAATQLSLFATLANLLFCGIFYLVSIIPGNWGESYVVGSGGIINKALDKTFGGTWYIILGSAVAFTVSAAVNNFVNFAVGKAFTKNENSLTAFLTRSYVSTAIGQFTDNFLFAFIVSRTFFGWSILQCITCSLMGMVVELICEAVFSVFGYKVSEKWRQNGVGKEYLCYINDYNTR